MAGRRAFNPGPRLATPTGPTGSGIIRFSLESRLQAVFARKRTPPEGGTPASIAGIRHDFIECDAKLAESWIGSRCAVDAEQITGLRLVTVRVPQRPREQFLVRLSLVTRWWTSFSPSRSAASVNSTRSRLPEPSVTGAAACLWVCVGQARAGPRAGAFARTSGTPRPEYSSATRGRCRASHVAWSRSRASGAKPRSIAIGFRGHSRKRK